MGGAPTGGYPANFGNLLVMTLSHASAGLGCGACL